MDCFFVIYTFNHRELKKVAYLWQTVIIHTKYFWCDEIKKNWIGGACDTKKWQHSSQSSLWEHKIPEEIEITLQLMWSFPCRIFRPSCVISFPFTTGENKVKYFGKLLHFCTICRPKNMTFHLPQADSSVSNLWEKFTFH